MMNRNDPMQALPSSSNDPDTSAPGIERVREAVSALFDGEADELELRRLLTSDRAESVRNAWRDYQLQRDALQSVDMRFAGFDISARVQAAIAADAVPAAAVGGARWWRPLASVAVAASVATVVVIGARSFNPTFNPAGNFDSGGTVAQTPASVNSGRVYPAQINPSIGNVAVSAQSFGPSVAGQALAGAGQTFAGKEATNNGFSQLVFPRNDVLAQTVAGAQTVAFDADQLAQQRLQQYLLRHTERAALNGQGVINFSKVSELNAE